MAATRQFPRPAGVVLFSEERFVSLAVICDHS